MCVYCVYANDIVADNPTHFHIYILLYATEKIEEQQRQQQLIYLSVDLSINLSSMAVNDLSK